jgi:hypothetical protein
VIGAEPSFPACLAEALALGPGELPTPEGDPGVFWRQWLAERNLGLAPIADPAAFAWPGFWIAAYVARDGDRDAVLMFGVPSGPVFDPHAALTESGHIVEAVVIAPFDLGLEPGAPYGAIPSAGGSVAALLVAPAATSDLVRVEEARAVAGSGLVGDRYAAGAGTFSGAGRGYQLTLIEAEALAALADDGVEIAWEDARRNVVTRGVRLNGLVGRRFLLGNVECVGRRLAEPCSHLQRLAPAGTLRGLVHRGGLRADIIGGGTVAVGDPVVPLGDG